jgi:hypothetical protein
MTIKVRSDLTTDYADNVTGAITGANHQNFVASAVMGYVSSYATSTPALSTDDSIILLDGTSNTVTAALPAAASSEHAVFFIKAINITFAVAVDPGSDNLEGTTTDYTFATALDAIIIACDGAAWHILAEFLNA